MTDALKKFIAEAYGIKVQAVTPIEGGFYGKVFRVDAPCGSYAAKLDLWRTHSAEFRESLAVVDGLTAQGLEFVPPLLHGINGERCFEFGGGVLALFAFAEGEHTEDVSADTLFELLGRVYSGCAVQAEKPLFSMEMYERVVSLQEKLNDSDEAHRAINDLLAEKAELIEKRRRCLALFAERCNGKEFPAVLTHGDAGGNCIVGKGGISLSDWDTARVSAPERDAWAHMSSAENIALIEEGLGRGGFDYRLDNDAFAYFANAWFFEYIGNYLVSAIDGDAGKRREMYEGLKDYFGCWIFGVLKKADEYI